MDKERKLNKVGFCIFGHVFGHQSISNGLIRDLKIDDETSVEFPKGIFLNKDNRPVVIISREILSNGLEIIKIFIVIYAETQTVKRDGETVGCAIAFSGDPTSLLLNKALNKTFLESKKLIDINSVFKKQEINAANIELIDPSTQGLIEGDFIRRSQNDEVRGIYGVFVEGNILNQIMSVVQAFMCNPNFKNIEKLYVSEESSFLKKLFDDNKIVTSRHLLDYSKYHKSYSDKLSSQKKQIKLNEEKLSEFEKEFKRVSENKQKQLIDLSEKVNQQNKTITELNQKGKQIISKIDNYNNDLAQKNKQTNTLSEEINKKNHELQEIKARISKISVNKFQELLDHNSFKEERNSYEQKFLVKQEQLNEKLARLEDQTMFTKRLAIVFGVLALLIFIGGGILGYSINNTANNDGIFVGSTIIDQKPKETKIIAEKTIIKAPQEHKVADFLTLSLEKQNSHKAELDKFIEEIQKADTRKVNISNFINRNWNFAEVIDYNKNVIDHGLARLKKIKLILEQNGKPVSYFTEEFMIDSKEKFNSREFDFRTESRNKILELYLQNPGNMYEGMNIQTEGVTDFEKDLPLLYMHFRWVLFNLSNYENSDGKSTDADILKTYKTKHNIPLNN